MNRRRALPADAPSRGAAAGFTLMELVIVSLLAMIFLGIALPTLKNNLFSDELDGTARRVIGIVQELRNLAVRQHRAYLLHFDLDGNRLWYELDGTVNVFNDQPENVFQLPQAVRLAEVQPHSQQKESRGLVTLWISTQGYMDQTVVRLNGGNDRTISLLFSPFSGSTTVYDGYLEVD